jgi:hypothetical protein
MRNSADRFSLPEIASRRIAESVLSYFNGLRRHSESVPAFDCRSPSRASALEKCQPGLIGVLKNNIKRQPAWQEIVDFS